MARAVLITGAAGQVGQELALRRWPDDVVLLTPSRTELDISDRASVERYFAANEVAAVVNCAAYTAVDRAEDEIAEAYAANAFAPAWLASAARESDVPIIHVSTDYVFGGAAGRPRETGDEPAPTSVYGASKLAGEIAVRAATNRAVILRTAWVVSQFRSNFLKTMLNLAARMDEIGVVADQVGSPTAAGDIADALQTIVLRMMDDAAAPTGTYHFVNDGEASWADFASAIMEEAAVAGLPAARIRGVTSAEYPTRVTRPADSRLSTTSLRRDYGIAPRHWRDAARDVIGQVAAQSHSKDQ